MFEAYDMQGKLYIYDHEDSSSYWHIKGAFIVTTNYCNFIISFLLSKVIPKIIKLFPFFNLPYQSARRHPLPGRQRPSMDELVAEMASLFCVLWSNGEEFAQVHHMTDRNNKKIIIITNTDKLTTTLLQYIPYIIFFFLLESFGCW